ncbi:MAG: hypothetical protein AAF658_21280, partial [Myxococcota bacterium]
PKPSNRDTVADVHARPARWQPVLDYLAERPIALELPDLRVIHACWHRASLARVRPVLGKDATGHDLASSVVLRSPFLDRKLVDGLEAPNEPDDAPHEVLMKGFEVDCEPFFDNEGKRRTRRRVNFWLDDSNAVLRDKPQVFGHYWNCPPIDGDFAPPYPSGHPDLRRFATRVAERISNVGRRPLKGRYCCVDFNGLSKANRERGVPRAFVGALRWPEAEVVWASARR